MKLVATLLISGFFFLSGANAQVVPVVDSTTYRQFFVITTADRSTLPGKTVGDAAAPVTPGTGISDRQLAHLKSAGLNDSDALIAAGILLDFRTQHDQLVTEYNNLPETRAGTNDATPVFLSRMENLVQKTAYMLNNSVSVAGAINLNTFLQGWAASQPQAASKPVTIYPKSSSAVLTKAVFRTDGATVKPAVVVGSCTLTPHYDANMALSYNTLTSILNPYITSSGFTFFSGQILVYGPDSKHPYALGTNTSTAGAWFIVDYAAAGLAPKALDQANVYLTAAGYNGTYSISYADS
ncbi:MAG TPA: hypothetical protein VHF01_11150 [Candidatus Acidoferrum sp.]|nr:hypothetical protein [Candidatus Acidoferrum sp.]